MAFDREIFAATLGVPPFFFDIADRIYRHGQPIDPFAVGRIRAGTCWLGGASIKELSLIALSTKGAR